MLKLEHVWADKPRCWVETWGQDPAPTSLLSASEVILAFWVAMVMDKTQNPDGLF